MLQPTYFEWFMVRISEIVKVSMIEHDFISIEIRWEDDSKFYLLIIFIIKKILQS